MTSNSSCKFSISGNRMYSDQTRDSIHSVCRKHGLDEMDANRMEMAIRETCQNAIRYGIHPEKESYFNLELHINETAIKAIVISKGDAIDFDNIEPFDIHQDFSTYKDGGLGIPLIKTLVDDVYYERKANSTNKITLINYIKSKGKKERSNK